MKQLLFLLLFPCFALAQYQGNANQKITLGEQTTADGLVWRGVANDTNVITPFSDTSAYIILDTANSKFYHYNRTTTYWALAGGGGDSGGVSSFSAGTTGLTPSTATTGAVTLGGTLAVANGGTGASVRTFVDTINTQTVNGAKTFTSAVTATKLNVTDSIQSNSGIYKINSSTLGLNVDNTTPFRITTSGNWGIYNDNPQNLLSTFSANARGGVISNTYPTLMFNEVGNSKFIFGLNANEGYLWGFQNVKLRIATDGSEKMRIETNGNVGIGTSSPGASLHVAGAISSTPTGSGFLAGIQGNYGVAHLNGSGGGLIDFSVSGTDTRGRIIYTNSTNAMGFGTTDGVTKMTLDASGNLGIGTTSPQSGYRLHVVDSVYVGGNVSASAYTTRSDYDLKDEIQNISYGINEVMQMQPVKYTYKSNGSTQLGFIAQDLGVITPEVVSFEDKMSVYYNALIPILTKAIQEQTIIIKQLEDRILILENK